MQSNNGSLNDYNVETTIRFSCKVKSYVPGAISDEHAMDEVEQNLTNVVEGIEKYFAQQAPNYEFLENSYDIEIEAVDEAE